MIVIINGPPGVGKTTVAKTLARLQPGTVCIHGDDLRAFAPEDARAHLGGGSTYRAGATLAAAYLRMGASRVIFDYCFLRPRHLDYFVQPLPPGISTRLFTLWAPLPTVQARERERVGRSPLGAAVEECYREIEGHLDELGTTIDADADAAPIAEALARELAGEPGRR